MGINVGSNAVTGVYLGDQLLTKGGGDIEAITAKAIDELDMDVLGKVIISSSRIYSEKAVVDAILADSATWSKLTSSSTAMRQIACNKNILDSIFLNLSLMQTIVDSDTALQEFANIEISMNRIARSRDILKLIGKAGKLGFLSKTSVSRNAMIASSLISTQKFRNDKIGYSGIIAVYANNDRGLWASNSHGVGTVCNETMGFHKTNGYPVTEVEGFQSEYVDLKYIDIGY